MSFSVFVYHEVEHCMLIIENYVPLAVREVSQLPRKFVSIYGLNVKLQTAFGARLAARTNAQLLAEVALKPTSTDGVHNERQVYQLVE